MKRISLQWRLTCIITVYIAVICGCLTMFVYKNGVYYIDSLQETVDAQVLDAEDQPIEGLYVCGSAAGEFFGAGDYPTYVPGIGHGRCVTFGRIAGINAAGGDAEAKIPSLDI